MGENMLENEYDDYSDNSSDSESDSEGQSEPIDNTVNCARDNHIKDKKTL